MSDLALENGETSQSSAAKELASDSWIVPASPLKLPEILALFATLALWDVAVYGGVGYSAFALFLIATPFIWAFGTPAGKLNRTAGVLCVLLALIAIRLLWSGSAFGVFMGSSLIVAFSLSLIGFQPFPVETFLYIGQCALRGLLGQILVLRKVRIGPGRIESGWRSILIPFGFVAVFLAIFVFANPVFRELLANAVERIAKWLEQFPITLPRFLFWAVSLWCIGGLVRPILLKGFHDFMEWPERDVPLAAHSTPFDLFSVARNTLIAVVGLFIPYLCFEVYYYWVHDIPAGYSYSSYAHQGAFWLTIALAFSTFTLGFIFRGPLLNHPGLELLKKLTWTWSGLNFVLAICIVYRVHIYIEYNGLSKMRVVALFGIAAVFIGFVLVVVKVLKGMNLLWLIRRDLWALFLVCFVFALTPVDAVTTRYNVSEILAGNHAPSVLLSVHPIGPEGIPELLPLMDSEVEIIREGTWAILTQAKQSMKTEAEADASLGWKGYQWARDRALRRLESESSKWDLYRGVSNPEESRVRFDNYVRQWFD